VKGRPRLDQQLGRELVRLLRVAQRELHAGDAGLVEEQRLPGREVDQRQRGVELGHPRVDEVEDLEARVRGGRCRPSRTPPSSSAGITRRTKSPTSDAEARARR
jgi:hypothetical protein